LYAIPVARRPSLLPTVICSLSSYQLPWRVLHGAAEDRGRRIVLSHDRYTTHIPKTRWKRRLADFGRKNVLCMCCGTLRPPSDGGFYTQGCPPAKQSVGTGRTPPPPVIFLPNLAAQSADWNGVPPRRITMAPRDQICSPRPVEVASAVEKLRHAGCFPGSQLSILQTKSKLPKALAVNFLTLSFPACAGTKFGRETQARRRRRRRGPQSS